MLQLSVTIGNYDRTRAVLDGRAPIEGCQVLPVLIQPEEIFHRAFKFQEFDITEMSLSSHVLTTARGEAPYVAIPAYVSRVFRHSGIYIRTDRGIRTPEDLKGKRVGVPEYQITANVWIRGILQDEYGIHPNTIKWRAGGIEEPGRGERAPIKLPDDIDYQPIPAGKTLSQMMIDGEIDAMFSARAPSCFTRRASNIGRLFPNYPADEQAYYKKTGLFPIMHIVGIRRKLVEQHPWLPVSVYKAFLKAKEIGTEEHRDVGILSTVMPWGPAELERLEAELGADYWSYGIEKDRHTLETFARYSYEQGLSGRLVPVEEMFAHSTLELSKI